MSWPNVLSRNGAADEAAAQYKVALDLPAADKTIPLNQAIRELQSCGLAKDLKGSVLTKICKQLGMSVGDDNERIMEILLFYYCDETRGEQRANEDKFFLCEYVDYDVDEALNRLGQFIGEENFLILDPTQPKIVDPAWANMTFKRIDGKISYRTCASVAGVVLHYNEQLAECDFPEQFFSTEFDSSFTAFLIEWLYPFMHTNTHQESSERTIKFCREKLLGKSHSASCSL